jgi:hypothetical protein
VNKLLLSDPDVLEALNIGRTTLWELKKAGHLTVVRIGRRSFVTAESVRAYVDRLTAASVITRD